MVLSVCDPCRNPNQHLEKTLNTCRAKVEELEKNISVAEVSFFFNFFLILVFMKTENTLC